MAINAREAKGNGKVPDPIEPGSYPARLVQVIDFGLQPQSYNGESKPPQQEIGNTWELLDEFMKDENGKDLEDKPRYVSESFALHNLAADRAKSTQRYYALDPKEQFEGDWSKLLGTPAVVTIVQKPGKGKNKGRVYNNIATVSGMRPKDAGAAKALVNKPVFFDQSSVTPEMVKIFYELPEWIQDKIKKGLEFKGSEFDELLENSPKPDKKDKEEKREVVEEDVVDDEVPENW